MSVAQSKTDEESRAVFAGRIDILYTLGRHYLSLPFAVLCVPVTLLGTGNPGWLPLMPLTLQIAVVIAAEQLTLAYKHRGLVSDPRFWARRYVFVSAIAGATWGVGAWFWFVPGSYAAEAYLALAFLGMTATEFIARSAHRPAYFAHAAFALTPLVFLLLREGGLYATMTALLIVLFTGVLYTYCNGIVGLMDECLNLRDENRSLIGKLSNEKQDAEHARDAALASAQAKSVFIANISHELRTPLNALLGMAQLLDRAELGKPHRDHVKVMLEAGRALQTLLDDVIALTRADDDRAREEDCDPAQAARAVARLLQPRAWEKHLRLTVLAPAGLPRVAADPRRIRQVLLKLVDNALKFTDRGGVEIRVERDETQFVRFSVVDTGHGVPSEIVANLYKPFAPGDTSYARQQQGAGLGLSVVKRVVESAGGETGFESEPGEGAVFWFRAPHRRHRAKRRQGRARRRPKPCRRLRDCRFSSSRMTTSPAASSPIFWSRSAIASSSPSAWRMRSARRPRRVRRDPGRCRRRRHACRGTRQPRADPGFGQGRRARAGLRQRIAALARHRPTSFIARSIPCACGPSATPRSSRRRRKAPPRSMRRPSRRWRSRSASSRWSRS